MKLEKNTISEANSQLIQIDQQSNVTKNVINKDLESTKFNLSGADSKLGELFNSGNQKKELTKQNIPAATQPLITPNTPAQVPATQANTPLDSKLSVDGGFSKQAKVSMDSNNRIIIQANGSNDDISVSQDAKTGNVTVRINDEYQTFLNKPANRIVIRGGDGDDNVKIDKSVTATIVVDGENGNDTIDASESKVSQFMFGGNGNDKLIGGSGRDFIYGDDGNDTIIGGDGNDVIEAGNGNDIVDGGNGNDYINGSTGNDIIKGGKGNDVIYGGDGDDKIQGNDGDDYVDGGKGNDLLEGGNGNDTLSGGLGDDVIRGGNGNDTLIAGQGKDTISGDQGTNRILSQSEDRIEKNRQGVDRVIKVDLTGTPGSANIKIDSNGTAEFKERVEADFETMRSTIAGRRMLSALDAENARTGVVTNIKEVNEKYKSDITFPHTGTDPNRDLSSDMTPNIVNNRFIGYTKGDSTNSTIFYETNSVSSAKQDDGTTYRGLPMIALFHELGHAQANATGTNMNSSNRYVGNNTDGKYTETVNGQVITGVPIEERRNVGLPLDDDFNSATPDKVDPQGRITENDIRDDLGIDRRTQYDFRELEY
jgi:Ca2+-binding RTX toxin-like protein